MYFDPRPFWAVWNPDHGTPTIKHFSYESAITEAKRLASNHPGQTFYVLCATDQVQRQEPVEVRRLASPDDLIPF